MPTMSTITCDFEFEMIFLLKQLKFYTLYIALRALFHTLTEKKKKEDSKHL